ncbi:MAG: hypothetical protein NC816_06465 [Candidatus Omnitrophica bacterium]|nr:hypothetical protein [Candidatus Omnitrophota bacterium]MCM8833540.1 hypothetical protein [Candidatus Omnitrophota bacterium]
MENEKILQFLSDFNIEIRKENFLKLCNLIKKNKIKKDNEFLGFINAHIHTFHSFNYKNWSPLRIVFEGWKKGLLYLGTVDFDTLTGLEETLWAGELLNLKVISGFETRVFLEEMKDKVINSPNEPGIFYLCGKGFKKKPGEKTLEKNFFDNLKEIAQKRNKKIIEKINNYLKEIKIDYEKDVLPLTPSKNPTERHIIYAYYIKSNEVLKEKKEIFWSDILGIEKEKFIELREKNIGDLYEKIRQKLIKFGGPGYIKSESTDFPTFDRVVEMIERCDGLPIGTWLDGTNEGEKNPETLLELLKAKRIRGITIIPERNWNIKDENEKKLKIEKLHQFMTICQKMNMPVICGTEMNKYGQPFVDNFTNPEISKYLRYFIESFEKLFL